MGNAAISPTEKNYLDELIGRAMLNDDLLRGLLYRQSREDVLKAYHHVFSKRTLQFLLSISDKQDIWDLAWEIYIGVYSSNGKGSGNSH